MAAGRKSSRQSTRNGTQRRGPRATIFYTRSVACGLCGISERQLALWEAEDLIAPAPPPSAATRSEVLYDRATLERIRLIRTLAEDLEVNSPGIGIILELLARLEAKRK